jgi:hypothetical protein
VNLTPEWKIFYGKISHVSASTPEGPGGGFADDRYRVKSNSAKLHDTQKSGRWRQSRSIEANKERHNRSRLYLRNRSFCSGDPLKQKLWLQIGRKQVKIKQLVDLGAKPSSDSTTSSICSNHVVVIHAPHICPRRPFFQTLHARSGSGPGMVDRTLWLMNF